MLTPTELLHPDNRVGTRERATDLAEQLRQAQFQNRCQAVQRVLLKRRDLG